METAPPLEPASRWRGIVAIAAMAGVLVGCDFGAVELTFVSSIPKDMGWRWSTFNGLGSLVQAVTAIALLGWLRRGGEWRSMLRRWFGRRPLQGLAFGLSLTLTIPFAVVLLQGTGSLAPPEAEALGWRVSAVSLGPVAEEVVFRAFLFGVLWRELQFNPWVALVLSSLAFGGLHAVNEGPFSPEGVLMMTLTGGMGALLCWVFWRRGEDLCLPIGFHVGLNLWTLFLHLPPGTTYEAFWIVFACSNVASLALAYVVLRVIEERKKADRAVAGTAATVP